MLPEQFLLGPATGQDHVTILPRDPDWAFVFWEITADGVSHCKRNLSRFGLSSRLVLRIYCIGPSADASASQAEIIEYTIDSWMDARLVLLGQPGDLHQAVIGFVGQDDTFVPLCRSRFVRSPLDSPQQNRSQRYLKVQRSAHTATSPGKLKVTPVSEDEFKAAYCPSIDDEEPAEPKPRPTNLESQDQPFHLVHHANRGSR